eukprot:scaffold46143_cov26-Tisochrysis_lutea.AAC.12
MRGLAARRRLDHGYVRSCAKGAGVTWTSRERVLRALNRSGEVANLRHAALLCASRHRRWTRGQYRQERVVSRTRGRGCSWH